MRKEQTDRFTLQSPVVTTGKITWAKVTNFSTLLHILQNHALGNKKHLRMDPFTNQKTSEYIIAISVALFSALDNKYDDHHHLHFRV
jgi:hypothetical protein